MGWWGWATTVALCVLSPRLTNLRDLSDPSALLPRVSAQEPSFRSGSSELVVLPVVVTDKQGRYISDLDSDRFSVFDNGRRVPIEISSPCAMRR